VQRQKQHGPPVNHPQREGEQVRDGLFTTSTRRMETTMSSLETTMSSLQPFPLPPLPHHLPPSPFPPPPQHRGGVARRPEEPGGVYHQRGQRHDTGPPPLPARHGEPQHVPRRPAEGPPHGDLQRAAGFAHAVARRHAAVTDTQPGNQQPLLQAHLQAHAQVGGALNSLKRNSTLL